MLLNEKFYGNFIFKMIYYKYAKKLIMYECDECEKYKDEKLIGNYIKGGTFINFLKNNQKILLEIISKINLIKKIFRQTMKL